MGYNQTIEHYDDVYSSGTTHPALVNVEAVEVFHITGLMLTSLAPNTAPQTVAVNIGGEVRLTAHVAVDGPVVMTPMDLYGALGDNVEITTTTADATAVNIQGYRDTV